MVDRHRLILMLMILILIQIQLLKHNKVVNESMSNKFIYVNINHQHLNLLIFKCKKLLLNHKYNVHHFMYMLVQVKTEMHNVLHHLFSSKVNHHNHHLLQKNQLFLINTFPSIINHHHNKYEISLQKQT